MAYNFDKKLTVGNWEVQVDTKEMYGCFENQNTGTGGGLWFDQYVESDKPMLALSDYDGVYELPKEVCTALKDWGIFVEDVYWPDEEATHE